MLLLPFEPCFVAVCSMCVCVYMCVHAQNVVMFGDVERTVHTHKYTERETDIYI